MEVNDVSEQIRTAAESERMEHREEAHFRTRGAIVIAVLAMLLAIASLGGENATKEMINANIQASDNWAFYQAKNMRQSLNQLAADELEATLLLHGATLSADSRQEIQRRIERYRATAARYESEPDARDATNSLKGEGKRELVAQARHWETRRDQAQAQDPNFDYASALFQIAIVLGSVAIVATSRWLLWLAMAVGTVATLLMLNGFFLAVHLPMAS